MSEGRLTDVGEGAPPADATTTLDLGEAVLIPGLVNAHTHLGCSFLRGVADDASFLQWITEGIAPRVVEAVTHQPEVVLEAARAAAHELLEGGVTCVADSFFSDHGRTALLDAGLRGVYFREYFGSMSDDLEEYAAAMTASIAADAATLPRPRVGYGLAPHAPYTCPDSVLRALAKDAAERCLPLTIHVAESEEEVRFFRESAGPMAEIFAAGGRADRYRLGRSPLVAIDEAGALTPRTLVVHGVHLDASDAELLAARGATLVHCPTSNQKLATGVAPIAMLREQGVPLALGTDSPASTGKLDMFEEMRLAVLAQRAVRRRADALDAASAFEMATSGGARALGLENCVGRLKPGMHADVVAVRLDRARHGRVTDPIGAIVYSSTPDDVVGVWIAGERLIEREESM